HADDGIRDFHVTGVQTCALPILVIRPIGPKTPRSRLPIVWPATPTPSRAAAVAGPTAFCAPFAAAPPAAPAAPLPPRPAMPSPRSEERRVGEQRDVAEPPLPATD